MRRTLALVLLTALPLSAQHIDDPANLMGERVSAPALADTLPINHGAPALEQLLRKLRTRASMMMIVAHPDDEDSGLLTLESRGAGARVAMLTLTRGEGGQNLMSADFDDALGLIRTQELLAEDRYTGVDQMFGTEVDFGFSKTKEETLEKWGHDRVLYDAVRAVRLYRPLVLASVFVGGVTDGHGHHQVAGEITQEVFTAAGDPKIFPEMGLPPWTPLKVYARTPFAPISERGMFDYATGRYSPVHFYNYVTRQWSNTAPETTVTIHEGDKPNISAFHGMSYVQWARQGLALQKTQIGRNMRIPPPGAVDVDYTLYGSHTECSTPKSREISPCPIPRSLTAMSGSTSNPNISDDQALFTDIDTTLPGIANLAPSAPSTLRATLTDIDAKIAESQRLYNPDHLELTAKPLHEALRTLNTLIAATEPSTLPESEKFNLLHELRIKRVQLNNAVALALGLRIDAQASTSDGTGPITPGATVTAHARIQCDGVESLRLTKSEFRFRYASGGAVDTDLLRPRFATPLPKDSTAQFSLSLQASPSVAPLTRPFFSRPTISQPFYDNDRESPDIQNAPGTPPPFTFEAEFLYDKVPLALQAVVQAPVQQGASASDAASVAQPAVVVPVVSVQMLPCAGIIAVGQSKLDVTSCVEANAPKLEGAVELRLPLASWSSEPSKHDLSFKKSGNHADQTWSLHIADWKFAGSTLDVNPVAFVNGSAFNEGYKSVGYPGLTYTNYYTPATYKATLVDVTTAPNLRIAYLSGTGDAVPQFLPSLGVTPTLITIADLTPNNLAKYDAIVLGVRAYSAHPELSGPGSQALNDYAKQGGIVLSQYMSGGFNPASAPYPLEIPGDSAHNVVDEAQPVTLLQPANPLLTWPNKITSADFNRWVAERGHGFASDWSSEYQPLLETHDPDQDPQKGGLLVAKVGKGAYIYCAFALYRQLPEGVPGAYRLLANLLSYAKNPTR